ncbi:MULTISPECIES: hypothetical protein [unclassified Francisella]|uniref:hypothetical protein n=1 Tax=unclassified Francisella TaxID=2610885 RepID=UPI002E370418|nr:MULTISPECIES: hypothetical protein [unclassified Francisella]MED7820146.1 hypothetical protein [Francisella sp. 19S2-4]MED7830966.1 hypothetical protein [Francisella sp. 19S2-10]
MVESESYYVFISGSRGFFETNGNILINRQSLFEWLENMEYRPHWATDRIIKRYYNTIASQQNNISSDIPAYLDPDHDYYSSELALCIELWEELYINGNDISSGKDKVHNAVGNILRSKYNQQHIRSSIKNKKLTGSYEHDLSGALQERIKSIVTYDTNSHKTSSIYQMLYKPINKRNMDRGVTPNNKEVTSKLLKIKIEDKPNLENPFLSSDDLPF